MITEIVNAITAAGPMVTNMPGPLVGALGVAGLMIGGWIDGKAD